MTGALPLGGSAAALASIGVGALPGGQSRAIATVAGMPDVPAGAIGLLALGGAFAALLIAGRRALGGDRSTDPEDPVETLKERYVDGEIGPVEFERRLEVLYGDEAATDGGGDAGTSPSEPRTDREESPRDEPTRSRRSPRGRGCHATGRRRCG